MIARGGNARIGAHPPAGRVLSTLQHRFKLRIAALAALTLCIAQLGAVAHAYSHAPALKPQAAQKAPAVHDSCSDCSNFAPLLSAGGTPTELPRLATPAAAADAQAAWRALAELRPPLPFWSRAPPAHL